MITVAYAVLKYYRLKLGNCVHMDCAVNIAYFAGTCGSRSDMSIMLGCIIGSRKKKVAVAGWEGTLPPSQGRCRCGDKYVVYCMCFVLCLLFVMLSSTCIFVYSKQDPLPTFYRLLLFGPAAINPVAGTKYRIAGNIGSL